MTVEGNAYDGHTLKPQLEQVKELTGGKIKKAIIDKGYKVKGGIQGIDIVMPKLLKRESYYLKKKREERCRSKAGIEGLISHLKHDQELPQRHSWRPNQHSPGCCSIQYEEMYEIKTTGNIEFNFSLVLPGAYFGPGKYPTLTEY